MNSLPERIMEGLAQIHGLTTESLAAFVDTILHRMIFRRRAAHRPDGAARLLAAPTRKPGRKERVPVDEYTIEHVLPQNENLSAKWRDELGPEWQRVQETWLHTLGNLTLTGYNAEYSDRPFSEKRDMKGGFRESPLKLNEGLSSLDKWDEAAIKNRAEPLAAVAAGVWAVPSLQAEALESYRPRGQKAAG